MDFEKIAAEFVDGLSAGPIPEPAAEKVERAGRILASNGWNPNVAGEANFAAYHRMGEGRLYVTTNLSGEEMVERYSSRVCSRLKELCLPLHLKGADKRRWSAAKGVAKSAERVYNNASFSPPTMEGSEK